MRKSISLENLSKKLTKPALDFSTFGQKLQIVGKVWEHIERFWWVFYGKFVVLFQFLFCKISSWELSIPKHKHSEHFSKTIYFVSRLGNPRFHPLLATEWVQQPSFIHRPISPPILLQEGLVWSLMTHHLLQNDYLFIEAATG